MNDQEIVRRSHLRGMLPELALIMYSEKGPYGSKHYAEVADFILTKNGYQLLPGKPITKKSADQIAGSLSTRSSANLRPKEGTLIPKNVLSYSGGSNPTVAWVVKEQTLACSFDDTLNIKASSMRYPHMLFYVKNESLYVFAIKSETPELKEQLYVIPLPNIYVDCGVCLGDAHVEEPSEYLQEFMKQYENAFFQSEFNIYHGVEKYYHGINVNEFWNKMAKAKAFDYEVLRSYKKQTLKKLLTDDNQE